MFDHRSPGIPTALAAAAWLLALAHAPPAPAAAPPAVPAVAPAVAPAATPPVRLRINAIGDVNFNRDRVEVHPDGADVYGHRIAFEHMTGALAPLIDGDVVFANIETVVTDRNDFEPPRVHKPFCFRSHPNGVRALTAAGFNLLSLANNHSYDYGDTGIEESLRWMRALAEERPLAWAGIGRDAAEAARPGVLTVKGVRVGLSAITIGHFARERRAGPAGIGHGKRALTALRDADVHLRILSIHAGENRTLIPDRWQHRWARRAIRDYGVDLVVMHHPHRVQGVERFGDGLIFYGLGNGLMRGARDLGDDPANEGTHDYGLLARLDVWVDAAAGRVRWSRIEAVPLYHMHARPRPLQPAEAARRIDTLNEVSRYEVIEQRCTRHCLPRERSEPLVFTAEGPLGFVDFPLAVAGAGVTGAAEGAGEAAGDQPADALRADPPRSHR